MFLKEIDIQGFKSFADKTKITFTPGVTAIVGPNGSGKSNITESLRWVLGESSAKSLRGGKMPDVIFAGTENRRPLNYAQVKVVLDNSDGFIKDAPETISVERHIYRNGDSDYLIEGRKVRLRDIHELFMDTGLGRDSFSIISQGRVEAIFNSKAEERRSIFEEAAGVLKYKTRKKETESKLTQTQDNLDRVEDIIYELDQQVKPLEKQAQTAQVFLDLEEKRKQLYLQILVHDISLEKQSLSEIVKQLQEVQKELTIYQGKRQESEEVNQRIKDKRHLLSLSIQKYQDELLAITTLIADLEKQIQLGHLQQSQSKEKESDLKERLNQQESEVQKITQNIEQLTTDLANVTEASRSKKEEIKHLENQLKSMSQSPDKMIEQLREEFVALMGKEVDFSNQLTALDNQLLQEKRYSQETQEELLELRERQKSVSDKAKLALEQYDLAKKSVTHLLKTYQTQFSQLEKCEKAYQGQQEKIFDYYDRLKEKQARHDSLEAIQRSHSQFFAGVKAVLRNSEKIGGIIGAISEHLSFSPKYQTAMEIVLGASAQHIIVENEASAQRAIAFLKKGSLGRATFLPLTTIKPRKLHQSFVEKLTKREGFLGLAKDLVSYDLSLTNIMENLLGLTAIFDNIDHANSAARYLNYQVRIVTLDGTELRPGGAFSGGANRQKNTTFVKPELDQLETDIDDLTLLIKSEEKVLMEIKSQLDDDRKQHLALKDKGEAARLEEQKAHLTYEQLENQASDITKLYELKLSNSQDFNMDDGLKKQVRFKEKLKEIATKKEKITKDIELIKRDKNSIDSKKQELEVTLSQLKLSERELQSDYQYLSRDLNKQQQDLKQAQQLVKNLNNALMHTDLSFDKKNISKWEEQLIQAKERKNIIEQEQIKIRFESEDLEAQAEEVSSELQTLAQQNDGLIRKQVEIESQEKYLKQHLKELAQDLIDQYQVTFSEVSDKANEIDNIVGAKQSLKDYQKQLKALGPINLDAIDQYQEVNQRLTFLMQQKSDLDQAKDLLLNTISEMNEEVSTRFKLTFEAIRISFQETFRQMFGGGSADLLLTEQDMLSAGIEISVQPPGKKIQSLNLMSGGEKALSALALLFAIIRVKTIPFVILDEVEAALDEANVKRFGDYLNRFDQSSQFIVVTHRKGTMAAADSIYGVTMQESGISKVLSVKLKEENS